jgi:Mn-dependent DtxR family transcriptional regulator
MDRIDQLIATELKPYNLILSALDDRRNEEGIARISQKHIAEICKNSVKSVNKKMQFLQKSGSIEKISSGKYKLLNKVREYTPHYYVKQLI